VEYPKTDQQVTSPSTKKIRSVYVILNPVAGLTDPNVARQTITSFCEQQEWKCEIHETKKDEDLRKLVRQELRSGYDTIIAAGGDGTVSAVVSGMANSGIPMGILPAGTGNALARDLGIPLAMEEALALLGGEPYVRTLDGMKIVDDYYVLNASVGVSSQIMKNTGREEKRRFGMFAYLWRAVGLIFRSDMHRFELKMGERKYTFDASEVMITNTKFLGMQPQLNGVEIDPNDGHLDLFIVRARHFRDFLNVLFRFVRSKDPNEDRNLRYLAIADAVEIRSRFPLPVQADGEVVGNTPVEVKMIPNMLKVYVPAPEDSTAKG
jgi:YegS/Rv2252/BmrU family lipid kinase